MKTLSKCIFLMACMAIVVIAQRDFAINSPTPRFGFLHLKEKFCKHFCGPLPAKDAEQKRWRTFSLCTMKCNHISTSSSTTVIPPLTTTASISPTDKRPTTPPPPSTDINSNKQIGGGGGTAVIVDNLNSKPEE